MFITEKHFEELKQPFPLKWRVKNLIYNTSNTDPVQMVLIGYIDARQVQERFDKVLGAENWQTDFFEIKNKQFCRIGIKVSGEWIWKSDSGSESYLDATKGETSDSLKRAAVQWGVNRDSYELGEITIDCKIENGIPTPCDKSGKILKGKDLLEACKSISNENQSELIFDKIFSPIKNSNSSQEPVKKGRKTSKPKIILP